MKNVLHIKSSIFGDGSRSNQLADQYVARLQSEYAELNIQTRDVSDGSVPHLTAETFQAFGTAVEERDPQQAELAALSDQLVAELQQSEIVLISLPMYNFAVPSSFKAWIDHVARAGVTFKYTENGPEGLLTGKKVYVFATRGGQYVGTPMDSQTVWIKDVLGFLGMSDVEVIYAENLARTELAAESIEAANESIARLAV